MGSKANHHFIPQFYLRGFADGVGSQARLFTFDSETRKSFTTRVRNVGSRRYFNRVEAEGIDPDAIEDAMAEIEGEISVHLAEVVEAERFPSEEHFNSVLNLIANVSVRNPRLRANISAAHKEIARRMMDLSLVTEDTWLREAQKMKESGVPLKQDLTYQDLKDFHEGGEYEIIVDQTYLIGLEIKLTGPILDSLAQRQWCFVSSPEGSDFITSDDPAVLSWTNGRSRGFYSPGHGMDETQVFFPLTSRLALKGTFEDIPRELSYSPIQVAHANTHVARYCRKQIYARDGSFRLNLAGREDVAGDDLASYIL